MRGADLNCNVWFPVIIRRWPIPSSISSPMIPGSGNVKVMVRKCSLCGTIIKDPNLCANSNFVSWLFIGLYNIIQYLKPIYAQVCSACTLLQQSQLDNKYMDESIMLCCNFLNNFYKVAFMTINELSIWHGMELESNCYLNKWLTRLFTHICDTSHRRVI